MHLLITSASSVDVTLALCLQRCGDAVTVIEIAPSLREVGSAPPVGALVRPRCSGAHWHHDSCQGQP